MSEKYILVSWACDIFVNGMILFILADTNIQPEIQERKRMLSKMQTFPLLFVRHILDHYEGLFFLDFFIQNISVLVQRAIPIKGVDTVSIHTLNEPDPQEMSKK